MIYLREPFPFRATSDTDPGINTIVITTTTTATTTIVIIAITSKLWQVD